MYNEGNSMKMPRTDIDNQQIVTEYKCWDPTTGSKHAG